MKLVMRIDDFGYSDRFNLGALETIDEGVASHVEVMLDCPGTVSALRLLRERPWLSVGWHYHCLGRSLTDPCRIPSYAYPDGRFRTALMNQEPGADPKYEEVLPELRAQMDRCIEVLGRAPDFMHSKGSSGVGRAIAAVCKEYGIGLDAFSDENHSSGEVIPPAPRFKDSRLFMPNQYKSGCKELQSDDARVREEYDPKAYFLEDKDRLLEKEMVMIAFHPGLVDGFVCENNEYLRKFYAACCAKDISALSSQWLKDWIRENNVEIVNMRDAVYGTRDYQNHLKVINSPLYAGTTA